MAADIFELDDVLPVVFAQLSGLPTEWLNGPQNQAPGQGVGYGAVDDPTRVKEKARLRIHVRMGQRIGGDDEKRQCDANDNPDLQPDEIQTIRLENRKFNLEVRCESFNQKRSAVGHLMKLDGAVNSQEGKDLFKANNLAFIQSTNAISRDEQLGKFDKHIFSVAVAEFTMAGLFTVKETPTTCWIEHVDLTSCVRGVDGNLKPEPPNFTDKRISRTAP